MYRLHSPRYCAIVLGSTGLWAGVHAARASTINYSFDDGTNQGWTQTKTSSNPASNNMTGNPNPTGFSVQQAQDGTPPAQNGNYFVGPSIPNYESPYPQDQPHQTIVFSSPTFTLDATGNITLYLSAGSGSANTPGTSFSTLPADSSGTGFEGVALRNATTGVYVAAHNRSSGNNTNWELITFTNAELMTAGVLNNSTPLVLDLVDDFNAGWGWVTMDNVTLNGASVPEPASLSLAALGAGVLLRRGRRTL